MRTVTGEHGLASLVATHWLSPEPQTLEGLDGTWYLDGADIVGESFTVEEGGEVLLGSRILRHFRRDDQVALRVLDPAAPSRAAVAEIDAYMPQEAWVLQGTFVPGEDDATIDVTEIDGYVETEQLAGTVDVEVDGVAASFLVTGSPEHLQLVFSDATSGHDTYRFRFLRLRAAPGHGSREVEVDFNRAYLPPCAFADFYVCPLPAAQNRLDVAVPAGEKNVIRA